MDHCHHAEEAFGEGAESQMDLWATIAFSSDEPLSPSREQNHFDEMARLWDMRNVDRSIVGEEPSVGAALDVLATVFEADDQRVEHTEEVMVDVTAQELDLESLFGWARENLYEGETAITPSTDISTLLASNPLLSQDRPPQPLPTSVSLKDVQQVSSPPAAVLQVEPRPGCVGGSQLKLTRNLDISTPSTTEEDKRRRNTAASARFRKKKREREAWLKGRREELDELVGNLSKECAALKRENGWLKELVTSLSSEEQALLRSGLLSSEGSNEEIEESRRRAMDSEAYRSKRRRVEAESV